MTFLQQPLPGQHEYILRDIRAGLTLPDRWPENEEQEDSEEETEYRRWWEQDDNTGAGESKKG